MFNIQTISNQVVHHATQHFQSRIALETVCKSLLTQPCQEQPNKNY